MYKRQENREQAVPSPTETAVAPVSPLTAIGVGSGPVVALLPSWPVPLAPQHSTDPPESSAHAEPPPTEMAVAWVNSGAASRVAPPEDEPEPLPDEEPPAPSANEARGTSVPASTDALPTEVESPQATAKTSETPTTIAAARFGAPRIVSRK